MASRKTFEQLRTSNPSEGEIRDWIDTASIPELKVFVRNWSKHTVCGDYGQTGMALKLGPYFLGFIFPIPICMRDIFELVARFI
jgi:hypothetical protein